jgi:putative SOS response-associated peptidase YedK
LIAGFIECLNIESCWRLWCKDPTVWPQADQRQGRDPADLPTFRDDSRKRRCTVSVDGFFEWKAIKGQTAKQPYAIAMKDGAPFGIAGIWENWKEPASGEWIRTLQLSPPMPMIWAQRSVSRRAGC